MCYFLAEGRDRCTHADEFETAVEELVDMIASAQQEDGYLNIYFTVVDPAGRFKNLRCMHEMYNAGHLLEASLAHYHYTGSRKFLDVMIKVGCALSLERQGLTPERRLLHARVWPRRRTEARVSGPP